jgi:hypothetical protein
MLRHGIHEHERIPRGLTPGVSTIRSRSLLFSSPVPGLSRRRLLPPDTPKGPHQAGQAFPIGRLAVGGVP